MPSSSFDGCISSFMSQMRDGMKGGWCFLVTAKARQANSDSDTCTFLSGAPPSATSGPSVALPRRIFDDCFMPAAHGV